jgi:hypothetical protein
MTGTPVITPIPIPTPIRTAIPAPTPVEEPIPSTSNKSRETLTSTSKDITTTFTQAPVTYVTIYTSTTDGVVLPTIGGATIDGNGISTWVFFIPPLLMLIALLLCCTYCLCRNQNRDSIYGAALLKSNLEAEFANVPARRPSPSPPIPPLKDLPRAPPVPVKDLPPPPRNALDEIPDQYMPERVSAATTAETYEYPLSDSDQEEEIPEPANLESSANLDQMSRRSSNASENPDSMRKAVEANSFADQEFAETILPATSLAFVPLAEDNKVPEPEESEEPETIENPTLQSRPEQEMPLIDEDFTAVTLGRKTKKVMLNSFEQYEINNLKTSNQDEIGKEEEDNPNAATSHVVILNYYPQNEDEMPLYEGDLLGIQKEYDDGWALGQNISQGRKRCFFPLAVVTTVKSGPSQNVRNRNKTFRAHAQEEDDENSGSSEVKGGSIPIRVESMKVQALNNRFSNGSLRSIDSVDYN